MDECKPLDLGDACFGGSACRSGIATAVAGVIPSHAVAIAAGRYSTAVALQSGQVMTWGLNLCGAPRGLTVGSLLRDPETASRPRLVLNTPNGNGGRDNADSDFAEDHAKVVAIGYVHMAGAYSRPLLSST